MYVVVLFFSLMDLNGDILEGSWPSYCPDSALFSLWINRNSNLQGHQSGPFHQH